MFKIGKGPFLYVCFTKYYAKTHKNLKKHKKSFSKSKLSFPGKTFIKRKRLHLSVLLLLRKFSHPSSASGVTRPRHQNLGVIKTFDKLATLETAISIITTCVKANGYCMHCAPP